LNLYRVNPESDVPIYQQLADAIYADIKSGKLPAGTKLATVREMADQLKIAHGTVKRAYDELEKMGAVEMTQGRGTYIRYRPETSESKKERAMDAIEKMLNQLESLDISPMEAKIFIDLKLRERAHLNKGISLALIECSPEVLYQLDEKMHKFSNVETYKYLYDEILKYPYKIGEEMDIIVTSATHAKALENVIAERGKIVKVALNLVPRTIMQLALLGKGQKVGILCQSERFAELLKGVVRSYAEQTNVSQPWLFDRERDCGAYVKGVEALLVPEGYAKFCSSRDAELIQKFGSKHMVIECAYQIDQGSFIYLDERISELEEKRKISQYR
jgi:DNA-binding transcriptional regulator YhcF (GntR family)